MGKRRLVHSSQTTCAIHTSRRHMNTFAASREKRCLKITGASLSTHGWQLDKLFGGDGVRHLILWKNLRVVVECRGVDARKWRTSVNNWGVPKNRKSWQAWLLDMAATQAGAYIQTFFGGGCPRILDRLLKLCLLTMVANSIIYIIGLCLGEIRP